MKLVRDVWANKRCVEHVRFLKSQRQCRRRAMFWYGKQPVCKQHGARLLREKTK